MAYLSRVDLDRFAQQILQDFIRSEYPKGHLCYNVDPAKLAQFYGYSIQYVTITRDGTVLGLMDRGNIEIFFCYCLAFAAFFLSIGPLDLQ